MHIEFDPEGFHPPRWGLIMMQLLAALVFFLFVLRFWYLQILKGEEFSEQAKSNRTRSERVLAVRGLMLDRKGNLLAENSPAYAVAIIKEDCTDVPATLAALAQWTDIPYESLKLKYDQEKDKVQKFDPQIIVSDVSFEKLAKIEAAANLWPGLTIITRQRRYYPQGELFSHIQGYVGEVNPDEMRRNKEQREKLEEERRMGNDVPQIPELRLEHIIGKTGLEKVLEERLTGKEGFNFREVDARGRLILKTQLQAPHGGENLRLSLDSDMQRAAVNALGEESGCVIVMEPDTGKVRALVTMPSVNYNLFGRLSTKEWNEINNDPRHPLNNRTIQSAFPPGSVWKLMMASLILQEGINPEETVNCTGQIQLGNHTFRCWSKNGHGRMNLSQSLVNSCDVYYYTMGERLGIDKIEKFAKACGFGSRTGIDLPSERSGLVPGKAWKLSARKEAWQKGETLNVSIGQGATLVTPIQMATFVSSLINGGKLLKPALVDDDPVEPRQIIPGVVGDSISASDKVRNTVVDAMRKTVEAPSGTAKILKRPDAIMGGKTGTAQVVKIGDVRLKKHQMAYEHRDHAWMVSWGMKNDKKYVVVAFVEHGGGGSSNAGPVCKKMYDYLFGPPEGQTISAANLAKPLDLTAVPAKIAPLEQNEIYHDSPASKEALEVAKTWINKNE